MKELADDVDDIIRYFGKDFLIKPGKKLSPLLAYGDSPPPIQTNKGIRTYDFNLGKVKKLLSANL